MPSRLLIALAALSMAPAVAAEAPSCVAALEGAKSFRVIRHKVHLAGVRSQPFGLVYRTDRPVGPEKRAIEAWLRARERCHRSEPSADPRAYEAFAALTHRLVRGELTYGAYAQARMEHAMQALVGLATRPALLDD